MDHDDLTLQKCRALLHTLYGTRLHGIVLYGSRARGTDARESDIDLMVLLEGPVDVSQEIRRIWEVLYPLQLESDHSLQWCLRCGAIQPRRVCPHRQAKAEGVDL